jgi:hypothetical protein
MESIAINFMYNGINHLLERHEEVNTATITFGSIYRNLRHGFEWDKNDWGTNQIGHPYQGSNYFTSGRAHGLTFYESTAVAAFGSATWEYFFENNRASLNDFINTTVGGIALGEVMHRLAWVVRNPERAGKGRNEIIALAIDPFGGLARMTTGDSKRVAPKPPDMIPISVTTRGGAGVMWQGKTIDDAEGSARPFLSIDMDYGGVRTGRSKIPFGAFGLEFIAGGGSPISQANIRGRFFGSPFGKGGKAQFSVFQIFDYMTNDAYAFGGQGVEVEVALKHSLSSRTSLWMAGTGGSTFLGAVDALLRPADEVPERKYDYGPTLRFGGVLELQRGDVTVARLMYQGYQVNVVDGTRAFHVLQRAQLDIRIPIVHQFQLGMAGEFFFRKAYFKPEKNRTAETSQLRLFAAWSPATVSPRPSAAAAPRFTRRAVCRPRPSRNRALCRPVHNQHLTFRRRRSSRSGGSLAERDSQWRERAATLATATAFSRTAGASSLTSAGESVLAWTWASSSWPSAPASKPRSRFSPRSSSGSHSSGPGWTKGSTFARA